MFAPYRKRILEKLKGTGGMKDIEDRIVFESCLTPQDIHDRYHVLNGAIYGLASHGRFLRRLQARQPLPGSARPLPCRRRGASRPRNADGAHERLDRRGRARPGRGRRPDRAVLSNP